MAGRITKILLVLAIFQYGLRADAQAAQTTAEVLSQHEEQPNQEITWLAMAASITKILTVAGIFQYALSVDLPAVKVTEELLRQHEEQRSQEMAKLQKVEQRMKEQSRPTQESVLLSACRQWWFWDCVEMVLTLFGIYWLPSQRRAGSDSGSQGKTTHSAREQMEEEEDWEDKPLDKFSKSLRPVLEYSSRQFLREQPGFPQDTRIFQARLWNRTAGAGPAIAGIDRQGSPLYQSLRGDAWRRIGKIPPNSLQKTLSVTM